VGRKRGKKGGGGGRGGRGKKDIINAGGKRFHLVVTYREEGGGRKEGKKEGQLRGKKKKKGGKRGKGTVPACWFTQSRGRRREGLEKRKKKRGTPPPKYSYFMLPVGEREKGRGGTHKGKKERGEEKVTCPSTSFLP